MEKIESTENQKLAESPSFIWLVGGFFCSMLGDQFSLIALPWLVLKLTGDPLALGMVLAVMGIPRALFILLGGAIVDRYSAKKVIIISNYINAGLLMSLSLLVLNNSVELWIVYVISLCLGISTAFAIPAGNSIIPLVVRTTQLQAANSIIMIIRQLTLFAGPLLAGVFITVLGAESSGAIPDATGIGIVFFLDGLTFLISIFTLHYVIVIVQSVDHAEHSIKRVFGSMVEGLVAVVADSGLRTVLFFIALIGVFVAGPLQVGLPILATSLPSAAVGFGVLVAAYGVGVLMGMTLSGIKPSFAMGTLGITVVVLAMLLGLLVLALAFVADVYTGAALLLVIGALAGFVQVGIYTWIQNRVSQNMLGRTMSILMFCYIGLIPLTAALSGWIIKIFSLLHLFIGAGGVLCVVAMLSLLNSNVRKIGSTDQQTISKPDQQRPLEVL